MLTTILLNLLVLLSHGELNKAGAGTTSEPHRISRNLMEAANSIRVSYYRRIKLNMCCRSSELLYHFVEILNLHKHNKTGTYLYI